MREFTKSAVRFSWAMSLFGLKQMTNIFAPPPSPGGTHPATDAFNKVTDCTEEQFGNVLDSTFKAGDNLQRGLVDLMFGWLTLQPFTGGRGMRSAADAMADAARRAADAAAGRPQDGTGWGPIPTPGGGGRRSGCD